MKTLNELADWIDSIDAIPVNDENLREVASLLRAAANVIVGLEWTQHSHPFMSEARQQHNAEITSARVRIAALENERDTLRFWNGKQDEELRDMRAKVIAAYGEAQSRMEERDTLQRAIDRIRIEIDCRIEHGANSNGHLEALRDIIRRHATKAKADGTIPGADLASVAALKKSMNRASEIVAEWPQWKRDLLGTPCPPEPDEDTDPDTNPATVTRPQPNHNDIIGMLAECVTKIEETRDAIITAPPQPADDTRELIARLAKVFNEHTCGCYADVDAIIAAARKAGVA